MLKYYITRDDSGEESKEISYEDALYVMLGTWKDTEMTRDMLSIPNRIMCNFSTIEVKKTYEGDARNCMCLMPGLVNMLPMGAKYDDDGNRI